MQQTNTFSNEVPSVSPAEWLTNLINNPEESFEYDDSDFEAKVLPPSNSVDCSMRPLGEIVFYYLTALCTMFAYIISTGSFHATPRSFLSCLGSVIGCDEARVTSPQQKGNVKAIKYPEDSDESTSSFDIEEESSSLDGDDECSISFNACRLRALHIAREEEPNVSEGPKKVIHPLPPRFRPHLPK